MVLLLRLLILVNLVQRSQDKNGGPVIVLFFKVGQNQPLAYSFSPSGALAFSHICKEIFQMGFDLEKARGSVQAANTVSPNPGVMNQPINAPFGNAPIPTPNFNQPAPTFNVGNPQQQPQQQQPQQQFAPAFSPDDDLPFM